MAGVIAIVDPYSSGQFLAPEFSIRGYKCACIHSRKEVPEIFRRSYFPENFEFLFYASDHSEVGLVEELGKLGCSALVPGSEIGVILANRLASRMGLASCELVKLDCLRNKYLMQNQIAANGLRSIPQLRCTSADEAERWLANHPGCRYVVKPIQSIGTDGVQLCSTADEVRSALEHMLGSTDILGNDNSAVLLQEFIEGTEYVVDTVSRDGVHFVASTSRYVKKRLANGAIVYSEELFIHPGDAEVRDVVAYALQVLDAVGIGFGAAHVEIMLDREGPVLIEVGARLHGAKAPRNAQHFSDVSQIDLLVDAAVAPARFASRTRNPPQHRKASKAVSLISDQSGMISALPGKEWVTTLASYTLASWNVAVGDEMKATRGLFDSPGAIFLAHEDPEVIETETHRIRAMERDGRLWALR